MKAKEPQKGSKPNVRERALRIEMAAFLLSQGYAVVSVNGLAAQRGVQYIKSYIVHGLNTSRGWPDLQAFNGDRFLLIEVKGPKTRISKDQKSLAKYLLTKGVVVWVCRTIDELRQVVEGTAGDGLKLANY